MATFIPRLVIAGTHSGVGKTVISTAIMSAMRSMGLCVQPFKAGPDYIDPGYHTVATGNPSRNLDSWLLGEEPIRELFARAGGAADICLVEGVMGLYDGFGPREEAGSTAHLAKLLDAPVVLILDGSGLGRSGAAVVHGFKEFDPAVKIAGVIVNRVAGEGHLELLRQAIEASTGVPVLGGVPRSGELSLSERHLGLTPVAEKGGEIRREIQQLAEMVRANLDPARLIHIAGAAGAFPPYRPTVFAGEARIKHIRLAVARDEAFHFYYQDALDLLEHYGAELAYFSPLRDSRIPPEADGVYIGGGYPELYAGELSANVSMISDIRSRAAQGMPVYAVCGGLMYLCQGIVDFENRAYPMVGLVPGVARMTKKRIALGYVTAETRRDNLLAARGTTIRGHEFHWSELNNLPQGACYAYRSRGRSGRYRFDGLGDKNVLASYLHVHFGGETGAARRFLEHCSRYRQAREARSDQ